MLRMQVTVKDRIVAQYLKGMNHLERAQLAKSILSKVILREGFSPEQYLMPPYGLPDVIQQPLLFRLYLNDPQVEAVLGRLSSAIQRATLVQGIIREELTALIKKEGIVFDQVAESPREATAKAPEVQEPAPSPSNGLLDAPVKVVLAVEKEQAPTMNRLEAHMMDGWKK